VPGVRAIYEAAFENDGVVVVADIIRTAGTGRSAHSRWSR